MLNGRQRAEVMHEAAGALIIFTGAHIAFALFLRAGFAKRRSPREFVAIRLTLGRFLALGLEFQLASDILRTAVSPSFTQIGQLAAIAAIRTALNYFLSREIANESAEVEREGSERGESSAKGP
jgi:uncharacterized membrane protein